MKRNAAVVIPAHNAAETLARSIRSAFAQEDVQLVVTDDGSTDATAEVLANLSGPLVTVVRHDTNRGPSAARNSAVEATDAPVVIFLDADDELMPDAVATLLGAFDEGTGVVSGRVEVVGEGRARTWPPEGFDEAQISLEMLLEKNWIATSGTAIRTDLFREIGGFDPQLTHSEDYKLWLQAAARAPILTVPQVVARLYRDRTTASSDARTTLIGRFRALETLPGGTAPAGLVTAAMARTAHDIASTFSRGRERRAWLRRARDLER